MPVLMTAHARDLDVVRAVAGELSEGGGEIRCYLEDDDHLLRNIGCKIAVGRMDDADTLAAALTNVHTFLALAPDPLSFDAVEGLEAALGAWASAAEEARVAQNILAVGAAAPPDDRVAAVLAAAPKLFAAVSPLCVIECGLLMGDDRPIHLPGQIQARVLPLEDLARGVREVDDRESSQGSVRLTGQSMGVEPPAGCTPERFAALAAASLALEPTRQVLAPLGEDPSK